MCRMKWERHTDGSMHGIGKCCKKENWSNFTISGPRSRILASHIVIELTYQSNSRIKTKFQLARNVAKAEIYLCVACRGYASVNDSLQNFFPT